MTLRREKMSKISYILKSSQLLYDIYFYLMSGALKILRLFIKVDERLILFNSYGGKKYDDSPKAIYEKMLCDHRFDEYKLVWAIQEPDKIKIPGRAISIKPDTFNYFVIALKARIWITNSSLERGLDFKQKKTTCLNTWHGTPIKTMGIDLKKENQSFKSKVLVRADIITVQGQYDIDTFSRCFGLPLDSFRMTGLPRNDCLADYTFEDIKRIKSKIGIDNNKTVLLYAPTFREFSKGSHAEIIHEIPINLQHWQEVLGDNYVVLFRAHYEVARHIKLDEFSLFMDVSDYPYLNELMIVSDALISDYSSIFFDYSVMHKPMYCFAYDYDEYMAKRGLYLSLKDELPCAIQTDEDSLFRDLLDMSEKKDELCLLVRKFQQKYVTEYGHGAENSCDLVAEELKANI